LISLEHSNIPHVISPLLNLNRQKVQAFLCIDSPVHQNYCNAFSSTKTFTINWCWYISINHFVSWSPAIFTLYLLSSSKIKSTFFSSSLCPSCHLLAIWMLPPWILHSNCPTSRFETFSLLFLVHDGKS